MDFTWEQKYYQCEKWPNLYIYMTLSHLLMALRWVCAWLLNKSPCAYPCCISLLFENRQESIIHIYIYIFGVLVVVVVVGSCCWLSLIRSSWWLFYTCGCSVVCVWSSKCSKSTQLDWTTAWHKNDTKCSGSRPNSRSINLRITLTAFCLYAQTLIRTFIVPKYYYAAVWYSPYQTNKGLSNDLSLPLKIASHP